ncbi:MAG: aromatic ring-hydroxylating dioxygenase subunit alpha [Cyanobacteria bacterium P01_A01_bin.37]
MASPRTFNIFNNPHRFVEGWYWAIASHQLKVGQVKAVTIQGRDLAIYRGSNKKVVAIDAYCPHMGAHLAEGRVEGDRLRCFFHNWAFDKNGTCTDAPCLDGPPPLRQATFPTAEQYGMVWVWTGTTPTQPPPAVPELEGQPCQASLGRHFVRNCHPNVVMINAIDANHFNTVHNFPVEIVFASAERTDGAITFQNTTRGGEDSLFLKLIRPFYQNEITYAMCYRYGSVGTVTVGPDRFHVHIMFALRMLAGGKTEGQTILITPKRAGVHGALFNRVVLCLTAQVGDYFGRGDRHVFETIQFNLTTPTRADQSIVTFAQHIERQRALAWQTWEPCTVESPLEASPTASNHPAKNHIASAANLTTP